MAGPLTRLGPLETGWLAVTPLNGPISAARIASRSGKGDGRAFASFAKRCPELFERQMMGGKEGPRLGYRLSPAGYDALHGTNTRHQTVALPKEESRGKMFIGPVEVEVVVLDDGRRLVTEDGIKALIDWIAAGALSQPLTVNFSDELSED